MLPVKWKIYKVLTYSQFAYSLLCFGWFTWQMINIPVPPDNPGVPMIIGSILLLMVINPIINIIFITKNLPDKAFFGRQNTLYLFSVIINLVTSLALVIGCIVNLTDFVWEHSSSIDVFGLIVLIIFVLVTIINLFLLACQFSLRGFL